MKQPWRNEEVLEFLKLYRDERILWDTRHPSHRNTGENTNAWLRIQSALSIDCSVENLKKKKDTLLTLFRLNVNKKKKSSSYEPTWFAYSLMESFLGGKYECDSSNTENEFANNSGAQSTQSIGPGHSNRTTYSDKHADKHKPPCNNKMKAGSIPSQIETNSEFVYAAKKMAEAVSILKTTANEKIDECELYAQLLAKKLRKLDEHQRDLAMHQIDNIMFRAKMKSEQRSRNVSSPPSPGSSIFIVTSDSYENILDEETEEAIKTQPPS